MAKKDFETYILTSVDIFKQALADLGIKATEVLAHKEYSDCLIIVTRAGRKLMWRKPECHIQ